MAICPKCGANVPDGTTYCPTCGAPLYFQEAPVQNVPANNAAAASAAGTPCMVLGILSLVFCGLVGLILAIVAKSKVKNYERQFGPATGKAKVGKILSTLGLVFSIIAIVGSVIYMIVIAGLIASGALDTSSGSITSLFRDLIYQLK